MEIPDIGELERGGVRKFYERIPVSRGLDPSQDRSTMGQRVADRVARFGGSWVFIGLFFLVLAPLILMSQNRQSEKDRQRAQADYAVNLKAEMEILALHEKLDELRERSRPELIAQQERQLKLLEQLAGTRK